MLSGIIYQYIATKYSKFKYPPRGKMIDLGGYRLHMVEQGEKWKGPVVIIDAGIASNSLDWSLVQPEIAKFAHVITYDRAGYGDSDRSPLLRNSENMMKELHVMLQNANIPAPYILVGHSLGGLNVRLFNHLYPQEVAGIILVDAAHEEQLEKTSKYLPLPSVLSFWIAKIALYLGVLHIPKIKKIFFSDKFEKFSPEIQRIYFAKKIIAKNIDTTFEELFLIPKDCNQLKKYSDTIIDKPLIVISAGKGLECKNQFKCEEEFNEMNAVLRALQADLVKKSSNSKQIIAEQSGHVIGYDQPEIIIDTVREMVGELRSK
jgi:pimeloyl-ACP methyl ester carboxylesterase